MADLLQSSAAAGILPPDPTKGIQTLSGILGLKQQQQQLQKGAADVQTAQAGAMVATQGANENQNLAKLLQDPVGNGIVDSNGNPTSRAQSIVMRAAPTTGADAYEKVVNAAKSKVEFNSSVNNLNASERQEVGGMFAGAAAGAKSVDEIRQAATNFLNTKQGLPTYDDFSTIVNTGLKAINHVDDKQQQTGQVVPVGMEAGRQAAFSLGRQVIGAAGVVGAGGIGASQSVQMDTGAQIQPGTIAPALAGGAFTPAGKSFVKGTPPSIVSTPVGLVRVAPGGTGVSVIPSTAAPGASAGAPVPNANPTQAQAVAQRSQAEAVSQRVGQVQAQAANTVQAQDALNRAREILESPEAPNTGAQFERIKTFKNTLSSLGIDTAGANDMNTLTKNLARYEASRATAAGLGGTDAARELAHSGSPNTQLDNKALQGIVRQSLATERVLAGYANVQSKTNDPQQQLQNETTFRGIPHPIETTEYLMSKTPQEAEKYLQEHGLKGGDIAKSAAMLKQFGAI